MLEHLIFRTMVMPVIVWTIVGGGVALGVKVVLKRATMPIWPMIPFIAWGLVRAIMRAWHAFA